jgi:hypothetical protein
LLSGRKALERSLREPMGWGPEGPRHFVTLYGIGET